MTKITSKTYERVSQVSEHTAGANLSSTLLYRYFHSLINKFFKILPIRENEDETLPTYLKSLQSELLGCKGVVVSFNEDPLYLTLVSILQYLIDNPECKVSEVKREVFNAISICNKLKARYITQITMEDIK